ncbi:thiamine-phosphate kinase [Desertihabitans brevis]|uniref:Thiamine-monophosphate kinase n=1 Tax=Desertihabitans brevis TaxID=2268447 RepID=A0A367YZT6_9ACTN|nr:thiamine-phosphate kinase [Desertihabitans brevis]RCK71406.1 thiamine-phosphate kinase [Desertihabitans brevis]
MTDQPPATLAGLGEFGVVGLITRGLPLGADVRVGPGDDAAVLAPGASDLVVTTDTMVEGVHFKRDWSSGLETGRKAVAAAAADVEAMGGRPWALVVSLSAPADLPVTWLRFFRQGVLQECELAGAQLVGGDTTRSRDVVVGVTVLGRLDGPAVTRAGARPGDVVAVRGRLGWAAAGLAVLGRGFRSPRAAVAAQLAPEVPWGAGEEARAAGATAMIDVSDGLLADLGHVCAASGVAIDLDSAAFEVPDVLQTVAAATGGDPLRLVLTGGEDHALAATFAEADVPAGWRVVGRVVTPPEADTRVTVDGREWEGVGGHDHFGA